MKAGMVSAYSTTNNTVVFFQVKVLYELVIYFLVEHLRHLQYDYLLGVERLFPNSSIVISRKKSEYVIRHTESLLIHTKA